MFLSMKMRQIIRNLFLLFLRISWYMGFYIIPEFKPKEEDVYEKKNRIRFIENGKNDGEEKLWNENIDPLFYDKKELNKVLETKNNVLEKVWNSRILYESTPRGNIVMFYDVYKDGFSYYSDQTGIPYKVLNAVAMKYVITFRCRDFFMDETISSSPFIQYNKDDEKKEQDKKNNIMKQMSSNNQSLPFVKFKGRQTTTQPSEMIGSTQVVQQQSSNIMIMKEYVNNRFIYKGKTKNWSPLQSSLYKKIEKNELKRNLDYKTFKNSRVVSVEDESKKWWRIENDDDLEEEDKTEVLQFWKDRSYNLGLFGSF